MEIQIKQITSVINIVTYWVQAGAVRLIRYNTIGSAMLCGNRRTKTSSSPMVVKVGSSDQQHQQHLRTLEMLVSSRNSGNGA